MAAVVVVTGGFVLKSWQEKLIFYPEALPSDFTFHFAAPFDEVFIDRPDGARLHALHFQATSPKGTIVYFHGNAGSLRSWGEIGAELSALGFDVVIPDFRTFGKSTGELSEGALVDDAQAWWAYAMERGAKGRRIVFGRSIGTGVAVPLAAKVNPDLLILETPFESLEAMAKLLFPSLPVGWLLDYRFRSDLLAKTMTGPVLFFHGTEDEVVPYASGRALFDAFAKTPSKTFVTVEGGHHNDLSAFEKYRRALVDALR